MSVDTIARGLAARSSSIAGLAPLLALPGPFPIKVGLFSDSRGALGCFPFGDSATPPATAAITTQDYKSNKGFQYFAEMQSGGRIVFPRAGNYGIVNNTTTQMAARVAAHAAAIAAAGCTWVVIIGGTNDPAAGIALSVTLANYAAIETAFGALGIAVLWFAEYPRGNATYTTNRLTGSQLQDHYGRHRAVLARANNVNVFAIDTTLYLSDNASTTPGDIRLGWSYDGLHVNGQGAYFVGQQVATFFAQRCPARDFLPGNNADVYSASSLFGALNSNPCMVGTGGTLSTGVTGTLANDYAQGTLPAGLTLAAAKGADTNGRVYQSFAAGGTPTGSFPNIDLLHKDLTVGTTAGLGVGGVYRAMAELEWDAGPTGLWCIDVFASANVLRVSAGAEQSDSTNTVMPAQAVSGVAITPDFTVVAGVTTVRVGVRLYAVQNVAVSANVRIKRLALVPAQ